MFANHIVHSREDMRLHALVPENSFVFDELARLADGRIKISVIGKSLFHLSDQTLLIGWGGLGNLIRYVAGNPFFCIWSIYPGQPLAHLRPEYQPWWSRLLHPDRESLIRYLNDSKVLYFMDAPNFEYHCKATGTCPPEQYWPVPIEDSQMRWRTRPGTGNLLRISYVGRGSVLWKIIPFVNLVDGLIKSDCHIQARIYTDDSALFERAFIKHGIPGYNIEYRKNVTGTQLKAEISEWATVHAGMGISVLEGATCGIPSICLDPKEDSEDGVSWTWLYERSRHDIGDPGRHVPRPLDEIITVMQDSNLSKFFSRKTREYVEENHLIGNVYARMLNHKAERRLSDYVSAHGLRFEIMHRIIARFNKMWRIS